MKKFLISSILFLFIYQAVHAQKFVAELKPDSLAKVLQTVKDTQRINTLNLFARRQLYMAHDSTSLMAAVGYTEEALILANKLAYTKGKGNSYLNKGIIAAQTGKYADALQLLQVARILNRETNDEFALAANYDFTGLALQQKGDNQSALNYFDSARTLYNHLGDTITAIWSMLNLGKTYFILGDYFNAYKTQQTAFNMTPGSDTTLKTLTLYNMSTLFLGAGLPELALTHLQKILAYFPGENIQDMIAKKPDAVSALVIGGEAYLQLGMLDSAKKIIDLLGTPQANQNIFHNIFWGRYHTAVKEYSKALPPLQQGLELAIEFNQPLFISKLHIEVARVYLGMKNYRTALQHAEQGLKASENIHALLEMTAAAGTLSEIYDGLKIYDKAYFYSKQEKAYHDSLISEEDKRKIALLQVENDLADQKRESELLAKNAQLKEQQLQRESLIKNIVIAGLLVFVIFAIVAIRSIALQRRNEKLRHRHQLQIKQFENENAQAKLQKHSSDLEMQTLRPQMNPHFIFNCLNAINHFIQKNETETASDYLTKFSRLIRMVLQSSSHKYISLHDELETLHLYIGMESVRFKEHFSYSIYCDPKVDIESVQIPPMLLQPFVENAIWHGLMHKKDGGKLSIDIKEEDNTLLCTIQDNGIGRKKAAELKSKSASYKKSMGMQITENRLKMLYSGHGNGPAMKIVDLENEDGEATGTKIILRLPVKLHQMAEEEI